MNKENFLLNPKITFLNHGSFGSCPLPIFEDYQHWQLELEREPVQFITKKGVDAVRRSKEALGNFINCDAKDLIFTPNPTHAINLIARSLNLKSGDEILSTNLEYGAMDKTWDFICSKSGSKYVRQTITLPLVSKEQFIEDFWKGYSKKTKVVFISEITSCTALKLPVSEIVIEAKKRGLICIVDGAHSPGHIEVNLRKLNSDFYTGACHKWMMTPKGSSFLYTSKDWQDRLDPLIVSWGYDAPISMDGKFHDYHQFNGTRDFTAYCTIPLAIQWMEENNWRQRSQACSNVLFQDYLRFEKLLNTRVLAPVNLEYMGQMISFPIKTSNPMALKEVLYNDFGIEIPIMVQDDKVYLRISFHWYNEIKELDTLFDSLQSIVSNKQKYNDLIIT